MRGVTGVYIGVFAGDLHTSTPAYIGCEKSILCDGGAPADPTPDVYAQILALLAEINKGGTTVTVGGEVMTSFPVDTYTKGLLAKLVDSSPETLDTLAELAKALGNDPNFASTIAGEIGKKANADYVNAELAKRNAVKGAGEHTLITTPDNVAQDTWAVALNKDTEAYGGGSFASGGGTVAGVSYEDFCTLYGLTDGEEAKALYDAARERESTTINVAAPQEAGYLYWFAHAEGEKTKAKGRASHAEGAHSVAENNFAHAEGLRSKSRGEASHTEGTDTEATAPNAHAEGELVKVGGGNAHGEGYNTKANGYASHAEGQGTKAIGDGSHAEGNQTTAEGHGSHAEGLASKASGKYSHAGGTSAEAIGEAAFAHGLAVVANKDRQAVFGQYNAKDTEGKFAFLVGWGWGESSRRNIYELDINGNANYVGDVYSKGERLARVSEIGGETKLYAHTVLIKASGARNVSICASFVSQDESAVNTYSKLRGFLSENGTVMASGISYSGTVVVCVSHIGYASTDVGKAIAISGIRLDTNEAQTVNILDNAASAYGYTFTDTVRALN